MCTGSLKGVGGEPGGWTNSQETIGVVGGEMVLLRKGLLQQILERENWPVVMRSRGCRELDTT